MNILMFPCDSIYVLSVLFSWWKDGREKYPLPEWNPRWREATFLMLYIALQSVLYFPQGSLPASGKYCVFYIHPSPRNHPMLTAWKVNVWAVGSKRKRYFFIAICWILGVFCYILMSLRLFRMTICARNCI